MPTRSGRKPARRTRDLRAKKLTGKQAAAVKGGGNNTYLPAVQKVREALGDGSIRAATSQPEPDFGLKR